MNREISKLNYRVHTDSIKENLIPPMLTPQQISYTYASEADLLNTVLFGKTAKEWRERNPDEKGNIRDQATIYQLLVLANMESYNAILMAGSMIMFSYRYVVWPMLLCIPVFLAIAAFIPRMIWRHNFLLETFLLRKLSIR